MTPYSLLVLRLKEQEELEPYVYMSVWPFSLFQYFLSFFFFFLRAAPEAYGGSQARDQIGALAARLRQSHSNVDPSCVCDPYHSSWQCQILNPLNEARD